MRRAAESAVPAAGTTGVHATLELGPEPGGRGNLIDNYIEPQEWGLGLNLIKTGCERRQRKTRSG